MGGIESIIKKIEEKLSKNVNKEDVYIFKKAKEIDIKKLKNINSLISDKVEYDDILFGESMKKKWELADDIIYFYKEFEPQNTPIFSGGIYLLDINSIVEENTEREPSIYLSQYGIITFATTIGGNPICFDVNNPKNNIIMVEYDFCSYNDDINCVEIDNAPDELINEFEDEDYIPLTYENIKKGSIKVAENLEDFLVKILNDCYGDNIENLFNE